MEKTNTEILDAMKRIEEAMNYLIQNPPKVHPHQLLTPSEVSRVLGIGERTVRRWIESGELKALRVRCGKRDYWRVRVMDLDEWIESKKTPLVERGEGDAFIDVPDVGL